nr:uncharacterized protein LOC129253986 [Lytechinus pictus]
MRRSLPREQQRRPRTGKYSGLQVKAFKKELKRTFQRMEEVTSEEEDEIVNFCKRATAESSAEVLEGMGRTFQNRRNWISEKLPKVTDILERYPRFRDTPTVIQQEFKLLLPEATAKLISKWETRFVESILHICKMSRLPKIQALMKDLYHPPSELGDQYEPSEGEKSLYAFMGAVYLLPSNAAKRTSLADAVQYFLVTRPLGTSVEAFIKEQRKDAKAKRSQPYLLGLGTRRLPVQYFVVIDEQAIPCPGDITSSVDVLFKLHYVFNIHYATELQAFYKFLEHFVYEVGHPRDVIPARAKELMSSITAISSK